MIQPRAHAKIVILVFLFFSFQAITVHAEKVSCHAQKNGVFHKLEIEKSKSKIQSISYKSITTDETESTCEIFAAQSIPSNDSVWEYQEKSGFFLIKIATPANEEKITETILLNETPTTIHLHLLNSFKVQVHNMECGLNGYLSPTVILRKGKSTCEFE